MKKLNFIFKMAWQDSRKNRGKLILFMSSIVLGVAALVAINAFNQNLLGSIDVEAKGLMGADLIVSGNKPLSPELSAILDSLPARKAREIEILSMAYLPKSDKSQFVRIKAVEESFPFYGTLVTKPPGQKIIRSNIALLEESMMLQYNLQPGDSLRLGESIFKVEAAVLNAFGSSMGFGSNFAPTVYICYPYLDSTQLVQTGSFLDYNYYFQIDPGVDIEAWKEEKNETFRNHSMRLQTVEDQKESLSEAFSSLNNFLNLVAMIALLLACIGVASSVMIYIKNKIGTIAILRCIGMKSRDTFAVFLVQIAAIGSFSVSIGAILGSFIQLILPSVLGDLLPYEIPMHFSGKAVGIGIVAGLTIMLLFALIPLIGIRKISPLRALRTGFEERNNKIDYAKLIVYLLIGGSIILFQWQLLSNFKDAVLFTAFIFGAFLVLFLVAMLVSWSVRKFFPKSWPFTIRQGMSNLYRPNNQTKTLIISIGLGTSILSTLFVIQRLILHNVSEMGAGNQPNMILFGIEKDQKEALASLTESYQMPLLQQVPIVVMELVNWQGKNKEDWLADTSRQAERWAINREARVTFRNDVSSGDKLLRGTYTGNVQPGDSIFISLAERYADALNVDIGDEMIWNVQGARIKTYVGSIREINFRKMETRFFITFPEGVLENAPQFNVLVTKSPNTETTAKYRSEVVKSFPNVSIVDLGSILSTLNEILNKVSYVIRFMAAFSILIGFIVLISSLFLSKLQRIKESVLLRTLGAVRKQILQINFVEYALLGFLASCTGIFLSLIGSYLLAKFVFEFDFHVPWIPLLFVFMLVTGITITIGLFNSREVLNKSPLEVLRKEI